MQILLAVVALLLLAVAVFAFQNPTTVTVRFFHWELAASVAVLTLGATALGALGAALLTLAARLVRWSRRGPRTGVPGSPTGGPEPTGPLHPRP